MDISIPMQTRMKEDSSMIDLSLDYHAHILPGCDHGSSSVDMSLKQMDMAKEAGIQTICATPHFYPHKESVSSFIERRRQTADNLWAQIPADAPRVLLGAEVLICDGMERLNGLRELCLEGTNELLLEMPFYRWPAPIWDGTQLSKIQNMKPSAANTSGCRGVSFNKKTLRWEAQIKFRGKRTRLGSYKNFDDAVLVRKKAEQAIFGEFLDSLALESKKDE